MISITSYFCNSRREDFVEIIDGLNYTLPDSHYINGAMELNINGVAVIDRSMWDLIDQLWMYIVTMLRNLKTSGTAKFSFPDQALKFTCERIGRGMVRVASYPPEGPIVAVTNEADLVSALKKSGIAFFKVMRRLDSKHRKDYDELVRELEQVSQ